MTRRKADSRINVEGLDELNRALKQVGPELKGELRKTNKTVADLVAADARSAARSLGSTAAHVAPSLKASAGALYAGVSLGGPGWEMAAGAEFGSDKHKQFKPHKGTTGYFLYPSIRRDLDRIETEYGEAVDDLLKRARLT